MFYFYLAETFRFEHTEYTIGESCKEIRVNVIRSGLSGTGTTLRKNLYMYLGYSKIKKSKQITPISELHSQQC